MRSFCVLVVALVCAISAPATAAVFDFTSGPPAPQPPLGADLYDLSATDLDLAHLRFFELFYRHDPHVRPHLRIPQRLPTDGPAWVRLGGAFRDHLMGLPSVAAAEAGIESRIRHSVREAICQSTGGQNRTLDGGRVVVADAPIGPMTPSAFGTFDLHWSASCLMGFVQTALPATPAYPGQRLKQAYAACTLTYEPRETWTVDPAGPARFITTGRPFVAFTHWYDSFDGVEAVDCDRPRPPAPVIADATPAPTPTEVPVALRTANGHYLVAPHGGGGALDADRAAVGPWETFTLVDHRDGTVSLRTHGGRFVVADGGGGGGAHADRWVVGAWERFVPEVGADGRIALRTANGHYLVAEGGGGGAVNANRTAVGAWEAFTLVPVTAPTVALQAHDGRFVTALGGGGGGTHAASPVFGAWQRFTLEQRFGGAVRLMAGNGQYLVAEGGGGGAVNANRWAAGAWETFDVDVVADGRVSLRTANGDALTARPDGGLVAAPYHGGAAQLFRVVGPTGVDAH